MTKEKETRKYEKSYKPAIIIIAIFGILVIITSSGKDILGVTKVSKIIFMEMGITFFLLARQIQVRKSIYWLMSYDFEQAKKMPDRKRKVIANRFANAIYKAFGLYLVYMLISYAFAFPFMLDLILLFACMLLSVMLDSDIDSM